MLWCTGAGGVLGREIVKRFDGETEIVGSGKEVDIADYERLCLFASSFKQKPALIINAAAYTDVKNAETNRDEAWEVNVKGALNMAKIAKNLNVPLVHISSDYVFDGKKGAPYTESDAVNPLNFYSLTKTEGENAVRVTWERHYIFRTSWLYGAGGKNFVSKIISIIRTNEKTKTASSLRALTDETGSPTWAHELAQVIEQAAFKKKIEYGTYHAAGGGKASRYEEAKEISSILQSRHSKIFPCLKKDFPADEVVRPAYSALDCTKLETKLGIKMKPWKISLKDFLSEEGVF